ncbi:MAG: tRNA preQ1(34) S-adenosylmethionine ribosyltransferase-isomerase QueA [Flammeovirgaceae bacterium]|nr:MAG: tRNA preQ1(34) S-adenosylmethionine ribosyltransferase-isomerase QueA [Flammeovirgaceae bacterium]
MLRITDFTYDLPQGRIATHPLPERDTSKLLIYRSGIIDHAAFKSLAQYLPAETTLYFNNTRVIRARLLFTKSTGAVIEIFLLHPVEPSPDLALAMQTPGTCIWQCTIGNLKRWKPDTVLDAVAGNLNVQAELIDREKGLVKLSWHPAAYTFSEVLEQIGAVPLPPYIRRDSEPEDATRYQTVYSVNEGAVAAPTAGLHFTDAVFESLKSKGIQSNFLTLHVSAGTFLPVKTDDALQHEMHNEQIIITKENILSLLQPNRLTVAVGTTAMRTLESLYWYGIKLLKKPDSEFFITQSDPYRQYSNLPSANEALQAIVNRFDKLQTNTLTGNTSIYIYPGYTFKICKGLITNFHLPASTLILLVAAFVGDDWKRIYEEALKNDYRFLSYGDSSLLIP